MEACIYLSTNLYNQLKKKAGSEPLELRLTGESIPVKEKADMSKNSLYATGEIAGILKRVFIEAFIQ
ncbi:MAG: hypothetical protein LIP01_02995 [Tannerellaceae bacterium]|nr:hypothetical protein [Tannerellaceae bacterium]